MNLNRAPRLVVTATLLAGSQAAFAQGSITLYGIVDTYLNYSTNQTATSSGGGTTHGSIVSLNN
uniref:porin n=1 Tax=Paraburkholderia sp. J63 TaxID=2805434 RepID=UPI0039F4DBA0